ncbi:ABC transporter permease subunit [Paenibacillus sp. CECT 9249]|uniref:ABC transporter permease n=1 Tax=Paenibacillus sp. CECT 9249 TaxID=2845385 RepID=UPI001E404A2E|nr:ABC transporter permease subunit [Paenibacillus sp. CECT 9249]
MSRLFSFWKLVHNENLKIYLRLGTWVMIGILAGLSLLIPLLSYTVDRSAAITLQDMVFSLLPMLNVCITIVTIVVAAGIVSSEFAWGTIKLLLIRPWTRGKILLSKYIALVLFALFMSVLVFALVFGISALLFPNMPGPGLWSDFLMTSVYKFIDLLVIATFTFMLSAVFRSNGLSIGMAMFVFMFGDMVPMLLHPDKYGWAKYLLFHNMHLYNYMHGSTPYPGMSFGFSSAVLAVYFAAFLAISWIVFARRDIA